MSTPQGTVAHCLELLAPMGHVSARSMFGGHGVRIDGLFVALIAFDCLYLKVDALTLPSFKAAGCEPFTYTGKGKPVTMGYWTVPPQAMDSPMQMRPWARLALDAALRAQACRRSVAPAKPRAALATKPAIKPKPAATPAAKAAATKGTRGRR